MAKCNTRVIWNEGGFGTRPYRLPLLIAYKQITPKSVIASKFAKAILFRIRAAHGRNNPVHFSPVFGKQDFRELAQWILDDHLDAKLHLQLHKIIWGTEATGV